MFYTEKTYDIDELCKCNMHTHSIFSKCSKPEMVFEDMIKAAESFGLSTLAITDHSDLHDGICSVGNYRKLKKRLSEINTPVRVLVGAEMSAYAVGKFGEPYRIDKEIEFCSYSCVHYHLDFWQQPDDRSVHGYAKHMLAVLSALFDTDRADNIAHPFSPCKMKFFDPEQKKTMLACITDEELYGIMKKGENAGCSWELHKSSVMNFPDFYRRFFFIGKEAGVHFTVGTDAHRLHDIDTADFADYLKILIKD
ncbi:MAG: PHP domain-containing protein [Clostridia bacterium]|nr:PHP domain-containing protein [Clostridia bacterium]